MVWSDRSPLRRFILKRQCWHCHPPLGSFFSQGWRDHTRVPTDHPLLICFRHRLESVRDDDGQTPLVLGICHPCCSRPHEPRCSSKEKPRSAFCTSSLSHTFHTQHKLNSSSLTDIGITLSTSRKMQGQGPHKTRRRANSDPHRLPRSYNPYTMLPMLSPHYAPVPNTPVSPMGGFPPFASWPYPSPPYWPSELEPAKSTSELSFILPAHWCLG